MTWIEKHSINCYSCNKLFDEREEMSIDEWVYSTLNSNGNYDGVGIEDIEVEESK